MAAWDARLLPRSGFLSARSLTEGEQDMARDAVGNLGAGTATARPSSSSPAARVERMTYTEFLDNSPMSPFLWSVLLGCVVAQVLDGFDFQSTSFALPLLI